MTELFRGVGVALATIFSDHGDIDPGSTATLAATLAGRGMSAVLVAGTTGEAGALNSAERSTLIGAVRAAVPPAIPVIAGTGATSERQAVRLTREAVAAGADAVLAWPPPGALELGGYFTALADAAEGRPVLAYHVPWVSAPGVPVGALTALPVSGVKDSSGDPDRLLDEISSYPGATYAGSSALLALAGPVGAAGAILALANAEPERCAAAFAGDASAQRSLARPHLAVRRGGVAALKRILAAQQGLSPVSRTG